ncbi:nucleoside transporter [Xanthomonas axonopodis Xac29-1]|nr:nucleoside transporter [Xanthomonas axonopodis Xac29-1]
MGRIGFGLFGLAVLIGITWLFSSNRRAIDWKLVATGLALQISFAALVLLVPGGRDVFDALGKGFVKVLSFVNEGSTFIFGNLMNIDSYGFIFAFQVLPTIIFFSALMGVLYHLGVMQMVVRAMAWAITKVMRVSGAETTSVCASVFIGQTEAPLTVRPYIPKMTQSELLTMMIGGMAHIAGGVLAAYVGMLGGSDPAQQAFYAKPSVGRQHHGRARHAGGRQAAGAGNRHPADPRHGQDGSGKNHQQCHRCGCGRCRRRLAPGTEHRRDAAGLHRADCADQRTADLAGRGHRRHRAAGPPDQPVDDLRLRAGADRLGDRHPVGGCDNGRFVDRPEGGDQRVRRLQRVVAHRQGRSAGRGPERRRPLDRHLRAVRLRQFQLDRDPDRRDRRAGAGTSSRSGQLRPACGARRFDRHLHDRYHCRRAVAFRLRWCGFIGVTV